MRNLYRSVPRPGKGKRIHPAKRGGIGWATRKRNDAADTGGGYIFVLTGLGATCDQIHVGQTRNKPAHQAMTLLHTNRVTHWKGQRAISARHRANPPQLWACFVPDRREAKIRMSKLLVGGYSEQGGRDTASPMPDLETILRVMREACKQEPARVSLTPPVKVVATVA